MTKKELLSSRTTEEPQSQKGGKNQSRKTSTIKTGGVDLYDFVDVLHPLGLANWLDDYFVLRIDPDDTLIVMRHFYSENMGTRFSQWLPPRRVARDQVRHAFTAKPSFLPSWAAENMLTKTAQSNIDLFKDLIA